MYNTVFVSLNISIVIREKRRPRTGEQLWGCGPRHHRAVGGVVGGVIVTVVVGVDAVLLGGLIRRSVGGACRAVPIGGVLGVGMDCLVGGAC